MTKNFTPEYNYLLRTFLTVLYRVFTASPNAKNDEVEEEDIPLSAHISSTTHRKTDQYKAFLEEQSSLRNNWGKHRRKRLATVSEKATPPATVIPVLASPIKNTAKKVPIAIVPASPRREIAEKKIQEAEKMKAELQKTREEYTTRLADLQCCEDQMKANSTANI